jgi:hypothetical protein
MLLSVATAAGSVLGAQAAAEGRIDSAGLKPALGGKAAVSQCAKDCIEKAKQLGYEKVVADSMACFMPYKGKQLSHADCCDKVRTTTRSEHAMSSPSRTHKAHEKGI